MTSYKKMLQVEKAQLAYIQTSTHLKYFAERRSYWELLLKIYELDGDPSFGIYDYIELLSSLDITRATVLKFISERIKDGNFLVISPIKRSRKTLVLSKALKDELSAYFEECFHCYQSTK